MMTVRMMATAEQSILIGQSVQVIHLVMYNRFRRSWFSPSLLVVTSRILHGLLKPEFTETTLHYPFISERHINGELCFKFYESLKGRLAGYQRLLLKGQ